MAKLQVDHFIDSNTFLHRWDPRVKTVSLIFFLAVAASLNQLKSLVIVLILGIFLFKTAGIPWKDLLKRFLLTLPFISSVILFFPLMVPGEPLFSVSWGLISLSLTREGLVLAVILTLRVLTAVILVNALVATTGTQNLFKALESLRVPKIFIQLINFTLRYFSVLAQELSRMRLARKARGFKHHKNFWDFRTLHTLGQLIGVLFLRSHARAERVYLAMLARGYTGTLPSVQSFRAVPLDYLGGLITIGAALMMLVFDKGGLVF